MELTEDHAYVPPSPAEVVLYLGNLDRLEIQKNHFLASLSTDEKKRSAQFYFTKDRHRYICSRGMLREILGRFLNQDPKSIVIKYGVYGKPFSPGNLIFFNLSHTSKRVLCAFAKNGEVGVDIEKMTPLKDVINLSKQIFSEKERDLFLSLPHKHQPKKFFQAWTRKEAYVKALGVGLYYDIRLLEFGGFEEALIGKNSLFRDREGTNWYFTDFLFDRTYISTCMSNFMPSHYRLHTFSPLFR